MKASLMPLPRAGLPLLTSAALLAQSPSAATAMQPACKEQRMLAQAAPHLSLLTFETDAAFGALIRHSAQTSSPFVRKILNRHMARLANRSVSLHLLGEEVEGSLAYCDLMMGKSS